MRRSHTSASSLALALGMVTLAGCNFEGPPDEDDPGEETSERDATVDKPPHDAGVARPDATFGKPEIFLDSGVGAIPVPARLATIKVADRPPPAISGGTLIVSKAGDLAVAADPDRDALYLVSLPKLTDAVRTVQFARGSEPGRLAFDGAGGVHVALRGTGKLVRVDSASATVALETDVCQLPRGVAFDALANELLVACASGELVALDASTHAEHARSFVALDLRDVLIGKDGKRFVSRYRSAELLAVSADGTIVSSNAPGISHAQRLDVSFSLALDVKDFDGGAPTDLAPSLPAPAGFDSRVVSMSPTLAWRTVLAPDGTPVMLHQQAQDDEVVISQAGGYGGGCQPIVQGGITRYDADGKPQREPALLGGGALIVDIAVSPDGAFYAVAKPGAYLRGAIGTVELLSTSSTYTDTSDLVTDPGGMPSQIAGDGGFISSNVCNTGVSSLGETQDTAVAFDGNGVLYSLSREPAILTIYEAFDPQQPWNGLNVARLISLSTDSVADTGHDLFHGDVGTGLACASCHGEGLDDGHIWNFRDFGARRTQNFRGGFQDTLPLHWEGDLSTFQHLVDEVMTRRMGGFAVSTPLADTLSSWMNKQPALRLQASDDAAAARGKLLFESAELLCTTCHTGATLTNNLTLDVGTGGAFQVPSLRGLGLRAPYMHDGCAPTLHERFEPSCGGGDQHGKTAQLGAAELDDLVAYLQTL